MNYWTLAATLLAAGLIIAWGVARYRQSRSVDPEARLRTMVDQAVQKTRL